MAAIMHRTDRVVPVGRGASRVGRPSDFVLDPKDPWIDESIRRIERKTFIKDGVIPEIQYLLLLPPAEAKAAFLGHLTQYSLVSMLLLASILGSALNPLDPEAYPGRQTTVTAFNLLAMIISCANLFGTCTFVLEAVVCESTSADRIHSVIAKADGVFEFGINMVGVGLQGTAPLIVVRAWISGTGQAMCIALTAVVATLYCAQSYSFFTHLQDVHPMMAQRWVRIFAPYLYRKEPSHAAVDELVASLRYLQQERDKTLTPAQLGACLDSYFAGDVLLANEAAFLAVLEAEARGRLAPATERLARKAFEKVLDEALEGLASEAISARKAL
mmetsp:Transcript_4787/g.16692  ORF Transcript_4787/g.16692 Transcript_4787/m.16692 type:complete len:330 (+) Transcript_4787:402-1391(+)